MTPSPMQVQEPRVTIVIVTWNKRRDVLKLLQSLQVLEYTNYSVVVVDNASTDGSADAIQQLYPAVTLLKNSENLGGTGGFNAGLMFAMKQGSPEYLWLLDNDAEVLPETLRELVRVLEEDASIGIAGSCIMSPEDHDLIVEAGAFTGWRSGTSHPHLRYCRRDGYIGDAVVDVDSVAACSALLRAGVALRVGLMDERYFLHWDDIDYCMKLKNAGFRVVAVMNAPAFHVAEKGYASAVSYYNFRNSLLFQAKYGRGHGGIYSIFRILGNYLTLSCYLYLIGARRSARYLYSALPDFLKLRFGAAVLPSAGLDVPAGDEVSNEFFRGESSAILFGIGSYEDIVEAVRAVKNIAPHLRLTVAVTSDRAALYQISGVDHVIGLDFFNSTFLGTLRTAGDILRGGYRLGITAGDRLPMPFGYLLPRNVHFERNEGCFRRTPVSRCSLWKVLLALLGGQTIALTVLLPVLVSCRAIRLAEEREPCYDT